MQDLNDFQRDLLVILAGLDAPNGLDIKKEIDLYYGEITTHGRLYPNLDDLVDLGLIDKQPYDNRSYEYNLTEKGRDMLEDRREFIDKRL